MQPTIEKIEQDNLDHLITPYFMHLDEVNQAKTEAQQKIVTELREVVQLRFAGDKNYSPVFPIDAMYRREGVHVVTYAERFAKQYGQFVRGEAQEVAGTPLENLGDYGISPSQISLCRALKIYNVEALHALDGLNMKALGMAANALKDMASRYMADRAKGNAALDEIERLKAEIEALKAGGAQVSTTLPEDEFGDLSDEQLKEAIAELAGHKPSGKPSREALLSMLRDLKAAA